MDNYELLSSIAENCHPKFIAVVDGKKEVVGEVVDGVVYLTEAGKKLVREVEPKPSKKTAKKVESANTSVDVPDDFDLGV